MKENEFFGNLRKALRAIHSESFSNRLHLDGTSHKQRAKQTYHPDKVYGEENLGCSQWFVLWIITIDKKEDKALMRYLIINHIIKKRRNWF